MARPSRPGSTIGGSASPTRGIRAALAYGIDDCRSNFVANAEDIAEVAHEAHCWIRDAADSAVGRELLEAVDRVDDVDVFQGGSQIKMRMPDAQLRDRSVNI